MSSLQKYIDFFYQRSQREQILILCCGAFLLITLFNNLLISPLMDKRNELIKEQQNLRNEINLVSSQLDQGNNNQPSEYQRLTKQNQELTQQLAPYVHSKNNHQQMLAMIRQLVPLDGDVNLISIDNRLENPPIIKQLKETIYVETTHIQMTGNFLSVLDYFFQLKENLTKLQIKNLSFQVGDYPNATIQLDLMALVKDDK